MPVDDGGIREGQVGESSTATLVFSFCYPSVADKTLGGDGDEQVIRRRRLRRSKGADGRARVVDLGQADQRRRSRSPLRQRLHEKWKVISSLQQNFNALQAQVYDIFGVLF